MDKETARALIAAIAAVTLVLLILTFVASNPWMLAGIAAVLLAVAAIIRAILSTGSGSDTGGDDQA